MKIRLMDELSAVKDLLHELQEFVMLPNLEILINKIETADIDGNETNFKELIKTLRQIRFSESDHKYMTINMLQNPTIHLNYLKAIKELDELGEVEGWGTCYLKDLVTREPKNSFPFWSY